jgi:two-component system chemotaxis sensor kinase CheA
VIRSSGGDLLKLLNDILDLAKVESNTVNLEIGELALADLRDAMEQSFTPVASEHGLAFIVELDDRLPATMITDPHRLRQVLKNLVSNACKFTEHGEVTLRMELARGGWSSDQTGLAQAESVVAISVQDTGIGIPKDLQSAMFEAFAQADGTTARRYGGTGLGLSISRNLVGLLGGQITLRSEPGVGSTFTVYLPMQFKGAALTASAPVPRIEMAPLVAGGTASELDRAATAVEFYAGVRADATVLIVDDDFRNRFALTALLERGHLNVVEADGGEAALAVLEERSDLDLILMDIMMPVMNGYETMAAIRRLPAYSDIPILAVTGKVVGGERERCLAAGASDYIPKPVDTAELMEAVSVWIPAAK